MPVTFDELADSPKYKFSDGRLTIHRQGLIAGTDIEAFQEELYPASSTVGNVTVSGIGAAFPGKPNFRVRTFSMDPFHKEEAKTGVDSNGVLLHEMYLVDIEYAVPAVGSIPDTGFPPVNFDPKPMLTHQMTSGGQFLKIPATGFVYEILQQAVQEGTIDGMYVPTTEHHVTDHVVEDPNWFALEYYKGKVNLNAFTLRGFSYPAETLLYLGYDAGIEIKSFDLQTPRWHIQCKFSAKVVEGIDGYGGHNHFWHEDLNDWRRVVRTGTSKGMYLRVDFNQLFLSGTAYSAGT